jgi:hypothetical protein
MSTPRGQQHLRLRAVDEEDLAVISATLQDALAATVDMTWLQDERRFVVVVSRFCWETADTENGEFERVHAMLTVDGVTRVLRRNLERIDPETILELLSVEPRAGVGIELNFAGGAAIRLECTGIDCRLEDVGEPWPTRYKPAHDTGD